ncbi:TPA: DinI-like family protein [Enterobacter asburiae]
MPRLEKILLKILSNQFEDCSSVLRLAGSDELSVYVGEKEVKKTAEEILHQNWERAYDWFY